MRTRTFVAALALALATPPAWGYRGSLTCESQGYRYNACNVDTQGYVRFVREISTGNLCRFNRTWGYDQAQIWVNNGCRAVFEYGNGGGQGHDNNSAAIAAGVIGALALGAIIANQNPSPPPQYVAPPPQYVAPPPQYAPPPPFVPPAGTPPPPWAVGSFFGFDQDINQQVQFVVGPQGRVFLRDWNGNTLNEGRWRDGLVHWRDGRTSWLARQGPDVVLGDTQSGRQFAFRRG